MFNKFFFFKLVAPITILLLLVSCGSDENASRIVIGSGNGLFTLSVTQYQAPFSVQVTDTGGKAVANQKVTISAFPVSYNKGTYRRIDEDGDGTNDVWGIDDPGTPLVVEFITCAKEDVNQNGVLDPLEDINFNGQLEPTNSVTVAAHPTETPTITTIPGTVFTDSNGLGYFSLIYPKSEANWSTVVITANAKVTGTESAETLVYELLALRSEMEEVDLAPPGGLNGSPYGEVLNCANPN